MKERKKDKNLGSFCHSVGCTSNTVSKNYSKKNNSNFLSLWVCVCVCACVCLWHSIAMTVGTW